ncbi:MAG: toprim domain-containing protein, partial [bacterium]|nr:toprim domain-containing protein [bacterium]
FSLYFLSSPLYFQHYFFNMGNICGKGGVMFKVADGVYNGRIFNPPPGEGKTHNQGSTSGVVWKHPGLKYDYDKPIYIVEGIIDALSLIEIGLQAIAVLSSGQDPIKLNLSEFRNIVFAFDSDEAGASALRNWKKHYPDAAAIMPVKGDWNDLLLSGPKDQVREYFKKQLPEFEYRAKLALAEDAQEYALLYYQHSGCKYAAGLFVFDKCYYFSTAKKGDKEPKTYKVSNFTLEVDHYQLDNSNPEEPVNRYYLKIKPSSGGRPVRCTVSANEIASPGGLTQMFLQRARVLWEGDKIASLALTRRIVESGAPVVRQLQVIGYDKESDYYIFKDFAIGRKGEMIFPNSKGFFEMSRFEQGRPAQYSTINPIKGIEPKRVYELVYQAWGNQGITAIAWVVASWFVHRVKAKIGFFPFLSFWGDTQVGKSMLTRFLNILQGLDEEGLPMRKVNTSKGEIRKLAQVSALFKALLESNSEDNIRFDLDALLTLYNDNPLQVRALKSNDIQTVEIPFQSSLLFVQNREPFKSKAQKERVISLRFKQDDLTPETAKAFNTLIQISPSEMTYFFPWVMTYREIFETRWFDAFRQAKNDIKEAIGDARITENHALVLAFHRLLCEVLQVEYDLKSYIQEIGRAKQKECRHRAESVADIFFDILNNIPTDEAWFILRDKENKRLIINLNEALQKIKDDRISFPVQIKDLQTSLREHPAYIKSNELFRFTKQYEQQVESKPLRAWVFDTTQIFNK